MSTGTTYFIVFILLVGLGYGAYQFIGNETKTHNAMVQIDTTTKGISITDVIEGEGREAEKGEVLTVHYVGRLVDGTQFDSSYDRGVPFSFTLGDGEVIPGWDKGLVGMKVGGTRRLVIAPEFAYGSSQVGAIPPDSTLVFEVSLINIK